MTTKKVTIPYKPRAPLLPFHNRVERWAILVAHRRFGKTVGVINDMIRRSLTENKERAQYAYIAPYYKQAKSVAWDYLLHYTSPVRVEKNISELWVKLINGATIRLYGADNPEAMRGIFLDGVVCDEFADWRHGVWEAIIRPTLSDRKGWATFIGTAKGENEFKRLYYGAQNDPRWFSMMIKASESGSLDQEELDDARASMTEDRYMQEYECSFDAAVVGAIYAADLTKAREQGRVGCVPYDPLLPVNTNWDLGVADSTSIWFWQSTGRDVRIIDYYEANGEGLPHYANVLSQRGYTYGTHYAPHDIMVRELGSGRSRLETAQTLGINFVMAPNVSIEDGIHAARMLLPKCYFDEQKTKAGLAGLNHYHREVNQRLSTSEHTILKPTPVHDWSSHASDGFRYLALSYQDSVPSTEKFADNYSGSWMG